MTEKLTRRAVIKTTGAGIGAAVAAHALGGTGAEASAAGPEIRTKAELKSRVRGKVLFPGDAGFAEECKAYNPVVQHKPKAIVVPACARDVAAAVGFAGFLRLPIAVQATGHGIGVPANGAVLINTRLLDEVTVDRDARTARIGGGVRWQAVVDAAGPDLAPLNGSSLNVGAVGFTLGGGIGPLGRRYGFAADRVRSLEMVTPDGRLRRVSPDHHRDLFWAVRGGKSNFGVVTSLEIELMPVSRLYGGALFFSGDKAAEVLTAYSTWTARLPNGLTTSVGFLRPPGGKPMVRITVAYQGTVAYGERLLGPLRKLGPIMDTVIDRPYSQVGDIYKDPPSTPIPVFERSGLLHKLDKPTVAQLLKLVGPEARLPPGAIELRHLGGALGRRPRVANAVGHRDAAFLLFMAMPAPADQAGAVTGLQQKLMDGLAPHLTGGMFPNFMSSADTTPERVRSAYDPADFKRLLALKRTYDPRNLFRVNHNLRVR